MLLIGYKPGKLESAMINDIGLKCTLQVISIFNIKDILKSLKQIISIAQINLKSSYLDLEESSSTDQIRSYYYYINCHYWGIPSRIDINRHCQSLSSRIES